MEVSHSQIATKGAFRDSLNEEQASNSLFRNKKQNSKIGKHVVAQIHKKAKESYKKQKEDSDLIQ